MPQKLTNSIVEKMSVGSKLYQISDAMLPNFSVRVHPSGNKIYYVRCGQRNIKIGNAAVLTTIKAREIAREMLALTAQGIDPVKKTPTQTTHIPNDMQLRAFIDNYYTPWVKVNRKSASQTLKLIHFRFKTFMEQQISELRIYDFEQTRTEQQSKGIKRSSINRGETALKAALNWGVHVGILEKNPLERMRRLKETDSEEIVRYLSDNERERLYRELDKHPVDQLRYVVIVSLNTGIRRGALLSLTWADISFKEEVITLKAAYAKTDKTQKIPMNAACIEALSQWKVIQKYPSSTDVIFPEDNHRHSWLTLLKKAGIENFRWHDMRHDFASRLVMRGVDLNTVRELLGHSDLKMTMRYAHLAPEAKKKAVDLLG